jgi:4-carboxymuconolactone decarboxylase
MSLLDPAERSARGAATQAEVTGSTTQPATLLDESWRDFVYAEVWTRPALDRRSRYLISIAASAMGGAHESLLDGYVRGALKSGELSLRELREAALHAAVYDGWTSGDRIDRAVTRAVQELGIEDVRTPPIRAEAWDPTVRNDEGAAEFTAVMTFPSGPPASPYLQAIHNFVFGEMWPRYEGLDQRSRRWITLVGVCISDTEIPLKSHIYAAMASGNCRPEEMQEFVLHYGTHCGWPKASVVQGVVFEMIKKVELGLPWHADLSAAQ